MARSNLFIFEITTRCNLACAYCYNVWLSASSPHKTTTMSFSTFQRCIDTLLTEDAVQMVTLAGGEPLLNKDCMKMASYCYKKGLQIAIATNGLLLEPAITETLIHQGMKACIISLPSLDEAVFNSLTQSRNRFAKIRSNIVYAARAGATLALAFTLTKQNQHSISSVIKFVHAVGASELHINRFCPVGRGKKHEKEYAMNIEELEVFLAQTNKLVANLPFKTYATVTFEACIFAYDRYPNIHFGKCTCGANKWTVDALGNLRLCEQDPTILGNLMEQSFSALAALPYVRQWHTRNLFDQCTSCSLYDHCGGGCRFSSFRNSRQTPTIAELSRS